MDTNIEKVKAKIKKLFALSKSPNENEALAALEKAKALMNEYCLCENQCRYEKHSVKATKRLSPWRTVLANSAAWLHCCQAIRDTCKGEIFFFGEPLEAFMSGEMYRYLSKTIQRMAKRNVRKSAKKPYREKYKAGIAYTLADRISEMGMDASWMPVREDKLRLVKQAAVEAFRMEVSSFNTSTGNDAFRKGRFAGKGISLNCQTTGHGGRFIEAR